MNVSVLEPCVCPNPDPKTVTALPGDPLVGEISTMLGPGLATLNASPLLATPPTVTTIFPEVPPFGTGAMMLVEFQLVGFAGIPLKVTVLVPWVVPKFVPVIVTGAAIAAAVGEIFVMLGMVPIENPTALLDTPATVTITPPDVVPLGTGATILVTLQLVGDAVVPLNITVLVPCVVPKFIPAIVTDVPIAPDGGDKLVILGAAVTVKFTPLLGTPRTVTTTVPVVAPFGTDVAMFVALQLVGVAAIPLNATKLSIPCVTPKLVPVIVTAVPIEPDVTDKLAMLGAPVTVKVTPLLATPETVTTTFPVFAPKGTAATIWVGLQLVGVAGVPSNVTALEDFVAPKLAPVIVTGVPIGPDVVDKLAILGTADTVKITPLLGIFDTVTTTFPVVAPTGTGATILLALQLVADAVFPLNNTVLVP